MKNRIREIRKTCDWSMDQLAHKVRPTTTASQINKLEKGQRELDAEWIYKLCRALQVRPDQLVPAFAEFFTPKQRELLARLDELDAREQKIMKEIEAAKG